MDYSIFLEKAKEIALEAGKMVRSKQETQHTVQSKSKYDFVTEVDEASEEMITSFLHSQFPDHLFFGEEAVSSSPEEEDDVIGKLPDDKYIWVIDPIDGTTNFIRGIPFYAISIALMRNKEIVVGVIYDIARNKLYYTAKNEKSYCDGKEIKVSDVDSLDKAIGVTSFPTDINYRKKTLKTLTDNGDDILSMRIYNCAALAACSIASGISDFYMEYGIHLWDFAAGKLLIENAGGKFSDIDGKPFHIFQKHVRASNGNLHNQMEKLI